MLWSTALSRIYFIGVRYIRYIFSEQIYMNGPNVILDEDKN